MLPALKRKIFSPKQKQQHNFNLGQKGENHAKTYLLRRGFLVLVENYQAPEGQEIDLIALANPHSKSPILVFCEVKTRSHSEFGLPSQAVHHRKLTNFQTAVNQFRRQAPFKLRQLEFRLDVITLLYDSHKPNTLPHLEHFENITWLR